ncbi:ferredoxin [Streptomyces varsoviensis]|uniref:ferredoxin n=1 Tax=Streptomyces varsoviensis TaxID=67373 RepID=UPI00055E667C|nr:ferredoxin [Streptomyces varsoviensis]
MATRVTADRNVCVGAGLCAMTAPAVFDQDEGGLVTVLKKEPQGSAELSSARQAGNICPSGAVKITE